MVENHWFKRISGGQGCFSTVDKGISPHFSVASVTLSDNWLHIRIQVSPGLEDFSCEEFPRMGDRNKEGKEC